MDKPTTAELRAFLKRNLPVMLDALPSDQFDQGLAYGNALLERLAEPVLPEGWEIRSDVERGNLLTLYDGPDMVNDARFSLFRDGEGSFDVCTYDHHRIPAVVFRAMLLASANLVAQAIEEEGGCDG